MNDVEQRLISITQEETDNRWFDLAVWRVTKNHISSLRTRVCDRRRVMRDSFCDDGFNNPKSPLPMDYHP